MPSVSEALSNFLTQRAVAQRQAMLDDITRQREERLRASDEASLALQQENAKYLQGLRQEQTQAAEQKQIADLLEQAGAGGTVDPTLATRARAAGLGGELTQGQPTQGAQIGEDENQVPQYQVTPGVIQFRGTPKQRESIEDRRRQEAYIATLPTDSRERKLLEYELQTGKNAPAGIFDPTTKPDVREAGGYLFERQPDGTWKKVAEGRAPQSSSSTTINLGEQGLDMAAKMYAKTGQLPPLGMGAAAADMRARLIERASHYNPDTDTFDATSAPDIASNKAGYSADTQALGQLTKNAEAVKAFEQTAKKNSELLKSVLDRIPGQNTPTFLNMPLRTAAQAFGNEDMAQFNALRQAVQNEYARLISNPNLVGVMTDTARKEMETVMSPNATVGQIKSALEALASEASNRRTAFEDSIKGLKGRIKGGQKPTAADLIQKYGGGQ